MDSDGAFKWFLRQLNASFRVYRFKRTGQTFAREFPECWQVVNVQLSAFAPRGEESLTVNFGICFKPTLRLRDGDESRAPRHHACPIRFRVGWLMEGKDVWWKIRDESSARAALNDILTVAQLKGIPFLDILTSAKEILALYAGGQVLGFEIDRDEDRLILLAETGAVGELMQRLSEYEGYWPLSPANERASKFLQRFKVAYRAATEVADPDGPAGVEA